MDSEHKINSLPAPRPFGAEMIDSWLKYCGIELQPIGAEHLFALSQRKHPLSRSILLVFKARQSEDIDGKQRLFDEANAVHFEEEDIFEVLCLFRMKAADARKWRSRTHDTNRKEAEKLMDKCPPINMGMLGLYLGWLILTAPHPQPNNPDLWVMAS